MHVLVVENPVDLIVAAERTTQPTVIHTLPAWLPQAVLVYLDHTSDGQSLRALARKRGCHASTVLRQVRRYENRRDDPLVDEALQLLTVTGQGGPGRPCAEDAMTAQIRTDDPMRTGLSRTALSLSDARLMDEANRLLPLLAEPGVVLAVAADLDRAAVLREGATGTDRLAVVDRAVAQAFALKDWIAPIRTGRIVAYALTSAGRAARKRLMAAGSDLPGPLHAAQHRDFAMTEVMEEGGPRRIRYNAAESPVSVLARKRDRDGRAYLEPELVRAAEQIRIDFEMAQMGPRITQNWDRFLTGSDRGSFQPDNGLAEGPRAARDRVAAALRDLGPGLGDVVLRCCCFMEGLEMAERHLGWAARSGKIVLRIALQRLKRHYAETYGPSGPRIG